jgi:two-component system, OmpR family, sensor kinase
MKSIRRGLLVALLAALATAGLIAALATYVSAREQVDALLDEELRQVALSLRDHARLDIERLTRGGNDPQLRVLVQIWDPAFEQPYISREVEPLPRMATEGFSTVQHQGRNWRVFVTPSGPQTIIAAQPTALRAELAARTAARLLLPVLLVLPLLALVGWWIVGRGLAPLDEIAGALRARHPASLEPVATGSVPIELQPLVDALNQLLQRLDQSFDAQRRFAADAAHELRTPLTALTMQIQLAQRAQNVDERATAFERLSQGVKRATRLVQQLLILARLDSNAAEQTPAPVDLAQVAASVVEELRPAGEARGIQLASSTTAGCTVLGHADALAILFTNLIDNAIRYSPAGGRVEVSLHRHDDNVIAEVDDTGPGIAPEERERVFDRFYRGAASASAATGSGLGLAIVHQIALLHGAAVQLGEARAGQGLRVTIAFPAASTRE